MAEILDADSVVRAERFDAIELDLLLIWGRPGQPRAADLPDPASAAAPHPHPGRRATSVVVALLLTVAAAALLLSDLPALLLVAQAPPSRVDAALVLAGDPWYERTATAAAMVRSGEAYLLVVTGGEPGPGDSAVSLRDKAIELGVPPERIRMEVVSRSTWESLVAVAPILRREGVRSVALVTSPYHQRRTLLAARKVLPGLDLRCRPALPSSWSPRGWWRDRDARRVVFTEYGKLLYYLLSGRI